MKIVVDGAANELHDLLPELVPDLITGDFDSILPNVLQYYRDKVLLTCLMELTII